MKDSLLLVSIGGRLTALPMEFVLKTVIVQDPVAMPLEYPMLSYVLYEEGMTMPLVDTSVFFGLMPRRDPEGMEAVIVDNGGQDAIFALLVDRIHGITELVVQPGQDSEPLFAGTAQMDDSTIHILSPMKLERLITAQIEHQGGAT